MRVAFIAHYLHKSYNAQKPPMNVLKTIIQLSKETIDKRGKHTSVLKHFPTSHLLTDEIDLRLTAGLIIQVYSRCNQHYRY